MCCVSVLLVFVSAESNVGLIPWKKLSENVENILEYPLQEMLLIRGGYYPEEQGILHAFTISLATTPD